MGSVGVIVLDTHMWVWWVHGTEHLSEEQSRRIQRHERDGLGVSAISCWEIAKLVEYGRLALPCGPLDWIDAALGYPGVELLGLTPRIAVESTTLPGAFHRDPADQRILEYPHVPT